MLQIYSSPRTTPTRQMLQEHIGGTVQEDNKRFDELGGGNFGLPLADNLCRGLNIPSPAEVRPAAEESSQGQQTVPEENAALDEMCETVEYLISSL